MCYNYTASIHTLLSTLHALSSWFLYIQEATVSALIVDTNYCSELKATVAADSCARGFEEHTSPSIYPITGAKTVA